MTPEEFKEAIAKQCGFPSRLLFTHEEIEDARAEAHIEALEEHEDEQSEDD